MRIGMGPCTLTDLARHKVVSLSTVSKSVDMLVRSGWAERGSTGTTAARLWSA